MVPLAFLRPPPLAFLLAPPWAFWLLPGEPRKDKRDGKDAHKLVQGPLGPLAFLLVPPRALGSSELPQSSLRKAPQQVQGIRMFINILQCRCSRSLNSMSRPRSFLKLPQGLCARGEGFLQAIQELAFAEFLECLQVLYKKGRVLRSCAGLG